MFCSFVLPAYKSDFLGSSISSILSQIEIDFELIIVNDASPYDLDSIVNAFSLLAAIFVSCTKHLASFNNFI